MPGLFGIVTDDTREVRPRVEAARVRLGRYPRIALDVVPLFDDHAWLLHARLDHATPTMVEGDRSPSAAFHGVLYNEADLAATLESPASSTGALIAALYAREGASFVERLQGEFALVIFDPVRRTMVAATDPIGNYPLYWHAAAGDFVVSSDLSALLTTIPQTNRLNLEAVADYLTIGAVLGDKTLVRGVHVLDPGTVMEFGLDDWRVSQRRYVDLASLFTRQATNKQQYLDDVQHAFTRAVDRATRDTRQLGLSLSGGLDSRTILAAVNGHSNALRTYTLGVEGCADQAIARQIARITGTTHRFFPLDASYLRDFLPNMAAMVSATDGLYLSHGLTEMLAIHFLGDTGIRVLLRGHGGELAKAHLAWPLHTDAAIYSAANLDDALSYLARRANYVTPGLPLDRILLPDAARAAGSGSLDSFRQLLSGSSLSPAEACSYLYLRELHRRFTVPSLELFRTEVEVRLPFVDMEFLRVLLGAPAEWRDDTEIHRRIIADGNRRLLEIRNSNTGAPVDAGPTLERVLDKLNSALKLLNVRGYRHYHNFDDWMRRSLLTTVETELAGEFVRTRGIIAGATIRELMAETAQGAKDRSYLLQVLLILELWMRENNIEAAA